MEAFNTYSNTFPHNANSGVKIVPGEMMIE